MNNKVKKLIIIVFIVIIVIISIFILFIRYITKNSLVDKNGMVYYNNEIKNNINN